ncbi:MAG: response regulator [Proteobacteria bacterium]|nr:response regulator [Pseudomonadota bacterium]
MQGLGSLLATYAGVLFINLILSLVLWRKQRNPLQRGLVLLWGAAFLAFLAQGAAAKGSLVITLGFSCTFFINLALANLISAIGGVDFPWRRFAAIYGSAVATSILCAATRQPFLWIALPTALAVAWPTIETGIRALHHPTRPLGSSARALIVSSFFFAAHNLDFPFLRDKPAAASIGFVIALLTVFALSLTGNAVVLERETADRTRIAELNRFQVQFFSNITHELRTPLTMILAPIDGLLEGEMGHLDQAQKRYLVPIRRSALRLLKLINDLLDVAKLEERYLRLRIEASDLRGMLTEIVEHATPLARRKRIELTLQLDHSRDDIFVDLEQMDRVVVNLLSNALKFTPAGGKVTLALDADAVEARISVSDTGIGIAPEKHQAVFERFSQADGTVTRRYGGTGLGLALAKDIVELHGGRISLESTPKVGSTFCIHLLPGREHFATDILERRSAEQLSERAARAEDREPREWTRSLLERADFRFLELDDATERRVTRRDRHAKPKATKVLVVEDNLEVLRFLHLQLQEQHEVFLARNGLQGLEMARAEGPDVIVTDFMMPELDGLSMIKTLRAARETAQIPIIMLTARGNLDDRLEAREAGADVYLSKPFSPRELRAAIRHLLQQRGRQVSLLIREHVRSLELIAGGLAHEIHNPLNYIRNAVHVINERVDGIIALLGNLEAPDAERIARLKHWREQIGRMSTIAQTGVTRIDEVVKLVRRYSREGYPSDPLPMDFDAAVQDIGRLIAPKDADPVESILELQATGAQVLCIAEEMHQAIRNLWQNAIDAAPAHGHVWVRTCVERELLHFEVEDDGPGIAPDHLQRIFTPFFTTKAQGKGMGLGLAITHQIVDLAGGVVAVDTVVGKGSTFRITLPLARDRDSAVTVSGGGGLQPGFTGELTPPPFDTPTPAPSA